MSTVYTAPGLRFRYPEEWRISEERGDGQLTVTARPPGESTAFWSATMLAGRPDPQEAIDAVVETFEEEYDEVDSYQVNRRLSRRPARGRDIEFVCLELTNSAFVRAVQTERFTALVLYQATDQELDSIRDDLEGMTESFECDLEESLGLG
jgi:hypothetical protein